MLAEPKWKFCRPLEGGRLELNVDASGGRVSVEVLNGAGQPLPGFTRQDGRGIERVDALRCQPGWTNDADIATLEGTVVRLRFHLQNADLYAFEVSQRRF